ncbi:F0F1 ATP synthase subunit B [Sphingomonas naphthae]|uniref:ATP synthase subunit b n=1 Tax=Sphingomonas naphthae TaxID=1813468 RepID=A0ABY7TS03_9SPHN|nr:F0F1 ATP synthase subunit B [Sphingomonas naphthae]WCT75447.1 F0F1 ATP synthase subunit B [Sphingomonas naphthae]
MGSDGMAPHSEPSALYLNGAGWVALAMLVLIGLMLWKKVPAAIGKALDKKIAGIRKDLDEAAKLRAEAEALKAEYLKKSAEAAKEADDILARAATEAEAIVARAESDASALIERRRRMAEDKIGAAERGAIAEVRAEAARIAAQAAAAILTERNDAVADKALIDRTISGIGSARLN